jgi:hypothetical protein
MKTHCLFSLTLKKTKRNIKYLSNRLCFVRVAHIEPVTLDSWSAFERYFYITKTCFYFCFMFLFFVDDICTSCECYHISCLGKMGKRTKKYNLRIDKIFFLNSYLIASWISWLLSFFASVSLFSWQYNWYTIHLFWGINMTSLYTECFVRLYFMRSLEVLTRGSRGSTQRNKSNLNTHLTFYEVPSYQLVHPWKHVGAKSLKFFFEQF